MKTNAKSFPLRLVTKSLLLLVLAFPKLVAAQGTLNALNVGFTNVGGVIGIAQAGVGWSFVPTSDLLVTAISSTAPQVSFWLGTNQVIANYNSTGSPTDFQSVSTLLLSQGQNYYISCQHSNFANPFGIFIFSRNGIDGLLPFTTSSYISQFASYYVSPSGQWSPTVTPPDNSNYLFVGPNFQFQVVPEPTSFELSLLTLVILLFRRRAVSDSLP